MTTPLPSSSWLESMTYKRVNGVSYLAFFLKPHIKVNGVESEPTAIIYGGPDTPLPSWLPGLVAAGRVRAKGKGKGKDEGEISSSGAVYYRLVREKFQGQLIKGEGRVRELKELMK